MAAWTTMTFSNILLITISILIFICYYQLKRSLDIWKRKKIPHAKPVPILGNFKDVILGRKHFSTQIQLLYNSFKEEPIVGIFIFTRPYLMIRDPKIIKRILIKDFNVFCNRGVTIDEEVDPVIYHNLFTAEDGFWKASRQKISPAFSSGKMKLMMPLIQQCADWLVQNLETKSGQIIDVKDMMKKYTVDVICLCGFGFKSKCLSDVDSTVGKMATQLSDPNSMVRRLAMMCMFFFPSMASFLKLSIADQKALDYFRKVFNDVIEKRKKANVVKNDFIDLLLKLKAEETKDDDYTLNDMKMFGQAITFFFAGNDSTSTMLAFLLSEIAMKTEIQDKMRAEIDRLIEECGDITYENLQRLKYMDMVIRETLRKHPVSAMLFRKSTEDYVFEETGLRIEKGTHIIIPLAGLHNDPAYYPDPERFEPERFSADKATQVPYTLLPFGEGPRVCLGERFAMMAMKVALFRILKDFEFVRCERTRYPLEINIMAAFLQPKGEVPLRCIKRTVSK